MLVCRERFRGYPVTLTILEETFSYGLLASFRLPVKRRAEVVQARTGPPFHGFKRDRSIRVLFVAIPLLKKFWGVVERLSNWIDFSIDQIL
jgi:hypothetical protein